MTAARAKFIIGLTTSKWLPTIIGRRAWWHRLYRRAANYLRDAHYEATRAER